MQQHNDGPQLCPECADRLLDAGNRLFRCVSCGRVYSLVPAERQKQHW